MTQNVLECARTCWDRIRCKQVWTWSGFYDASKNDCDILPSGIMLEQDQALSDSFEKEKCCFRVKWNFEFECLRGGFKRGIVDKNIAIFFSLGEFWNVENYMRTILRFLCVDRISTYSWTSDRVKMMTYYIIRGLIVYLESR